MYAGHFAAGLALRGRARKVPVAAFLIGAFVLDLLWIALGVLHVDRTPWDDWSHSLLMAIVWALAFAALFRRYGRAAFIALWLAVFSHFVLDLIVQGAALYPEAPRSRIVPVLVSSHARLLQLGLSAVLLLLFVNDERKAGALSWRTWAISALVLALNARFILGI
jgi:uncharacterized membrane protein (Fun14 family)